MTWENMTRYTPDRDHNESDEQGYYYSDTITGGAANGDWVFIPIGVNQITMILEVTAGEGKVQVTNDVAAIRAGTTPGGIIDWDLGSVVVTSQDFCRPIAAMRQVNVSGTTSLYLTAQ